MITAAKVACQAEPVRETPAGPEFLVVCTEGNVFRAVASAVRKVHGRLNCAPTVSAAHDYLSRRKVDGLVLDLRLRGAMELVQQIRGANLGKVMVIFACARYDAETQCALRAGANFVLRQPLIPDKIANIFSLSTAMMTSDKRRYARYPLMVPVELKVDGKLAESTMSNLSEAGMAIWSVQSYAAGARLQFSFDLPFGERIQGNGEVAWTSADGLLGIRFNILDDKAYSCVSNWIALRNAQPGTRRPLIPTFSA
jgi:CheY-like chemotaxis protein